MKLVVTLGAGASFDCIDLDTASRAPFLRPPLVNQLFNNDFNNILRPYRHVQLILNEIRTKTSRNYPLEALLKDYEDSPAHSIKKASWEIRYYLRELFGEISNCCLKDNSTKYNTLINYLERSRYDEVLFLTTNYDLAVEYALERIMPILSIDSYTGSKYSLVKLHGSVNWVQEILNIPKRRPTSKSDLIDTFDLTGPNLGNDILLYQNHKNHIRDTAYFFPKISTPIQGKTNFSCPNNHLHFAQEFINTCTDFLFIGFSGTDSHVIKLFEKVRDIRKIKIINGKPTASDPLLNILSQCNGNFRLINATYFDGFINSDKSGLLQKFIQATEQI